jgi:molecular chaperone GrpE
MINENKNRPDEREDVVGESIPVNDKRRFNEKGERITVEEERPTEPQKSPREAELEAKLAAEMDRRLAAEAKLVGVQARFDEAKASLEKETSEMRTRLMKTLDDRAKQAQFDFLTSLLPVMDNLNLAIAASESDPSIEHLRDGVIGTARSFERALLDVGVEAIRSIGVDFDPELHEAVDMKPTDASHDGKITAEYTRGYKFGDKLLRAARVQVGKGMAEAAGE